ncbi:MAG: FlgD immunoglobulin-like domain containing protein [Candidatus Neomarinimicrobiota bacterium]
MTEGNFASNVVEGYSVDNLAPEVPTGLRATIATTTIVINWNPSMDKDFQYYNIYRSVNEDFTEQSTIRYASTIENIFTDDAVEVDKTYYYRVTTIDFNGNESHVSETASLLVGIDDLKSLPEIFELSQNYPNPFNPTTTLAYRLPERADIKLNIFDITGQMVREWSISDQQAGWHQVIWDGRDMSGNLVSTGIYIYSLQAGDFVSTKKMLFIK